jgi:hypothetical protein
VTRIRRIRRVQTPLGFKVVQITNAYRVHEPTGGLGLLASVLFGKATESNYSTASEAEFYSKKASNKIFSGFNYSNARQWDCALVKSNHTVSKA